MIQFLESPSFENPLHKPDLLNVEGLKLIGGKVSKEYLIPAYKNGYFPWYSEGDPIMWFAPSPRFVIETQHIHIGKSNRNLLNRSQFKFTVNRRFSEVLSFCQNVPRNDDGGTWLTPDLKSGIEELHQEGLALSVETWFEGKLVGGFYGIIPQNTQVLCGESMFSLMPNASKLAFIWFCKNYKNQIHLIDCQQESEHLKALGAHFIPFEEYYSEYLDV